MVANTILQQLGGHGDTDTYTMYFYRQTLTKYADIKVKDIARYEGVYFDMLQPIFTQVTGLYTHF